VSDYDTRIRELRSRIAAAQRARARAEHERDAATAAAHRARTALAEEFGVTTPDEARLALDVLRGDLEDHLNALAADLDEIGA